MPYSEKLPFAETLPVSEISPISPWMTPTRKINYLKGGYDQDAKLAIRDLYDRLVPFTNLEKEMVANRALEKGLRLVSDSNLFRKFLECKVANKFAPASSASLARSPYLINGVFTAYEKRRPFQGF